MDRLTGLDAYGSVEPKVNINTEAGQMRLVHRLYAYEETKFTPENVEIYAKYESNAREMLRDAEEALAFRTLGLSPEGAAKLLSIVNALIRDSEPYEHDKVYVHVGELRQLISDMRNEEEEDADGDI